MYIHRHQPDLTSDPTLSPISLSLRPVLCQSSGLPDSSSSHTCQFFRLLYAFCCTLISLVHTYMTRSCIPYLAHTFGATPVASRISIGVSGLCFFIVGYARFMNVLPHPSLAMLLVEGDMRNARTLQHR